MESLILPGRNQSKSKEKGIQCRAKARVHMKGDRRASQTTTTTTILGTTERGCCLREEAPARGERESRRALRSGFEPARPWTNHCPRWLYIRDSADSDARAANNREDAAGQVLRCSDFSRSSLHLLPCSPAAAAAWLRRLAVRGPT